MLIAGTLEAYFMDLNPTFTTYYMCGLRHII